jgi:hypothetical protein
MSTSPAISAGMTSAEPRKGTVTNFVPVIIWNHSEVRCEVVPTPCVAALILPGLARAWAMNSASVLTGSFGLTINPVGIVARIDTGTNSDGSNDSFG